MSESGKSSGASAKKSRSAEKQKKSSSGEKHKTTPVELPVQTSRKVLQVTPVSKVCLPVVGVSTGSRKRTAKTFGDDFIVSFY